MYRVLRNKDTELRIVGGAGSMPPEPNGSQWGPKWISLLRQTQFPWLQMSEHLIFEAVLVPNLEVKWGKELKWQLYLRISVVWGFLNTSVMWGTKWHADYAPGTKWHNSQLWIQIDIQIRYFNFISTPIYIKPGVLKELLWRVQWIKNEYGAENQASAHNTFRILGPWNTYIKLKTFLDPKTFNSEEC